MNLRHTRSWLDPHVLTSIRTACVNNVTLSLVFSKLQLSQLLPNDWLAMSKKSSDSVKASADVVEALLGELIDQDADLADQLTTYITYVGERKWFKENPDDSNASTPRTSPTRARPVPRVLGVNIEKLPEPKPPKEVVIPESKIASQTKGKEKEEISAEEKNKPPAPSGRFERTSSSLLYQNPRQDHSRLLAVPSETLVTQKVHVPQGYRLVSSTVFGNRLVNTLKAVGKSTHNAS